MTSLGSRAAPRLSYWPKQRQISRARASILFLSLFLPWSLLTPSHFVSQIRFHQCGNHKKKLSLRHCLPTFGNFSFCQASFWLGVNKVLQKLTISHKSELRHLFQYCILIPRKCPHKTPFQHTVPRMGFLGVNHTKG
jgi:hypothetical protein